MKIINETSILIAQAIQLCKKSNDADIIQAIALLEEALEKMVDLM